MKFFFSAIILGLALGLTVAPQPAGAAGLTDPFGARNPITITPEVPIPGLYDKTQTIDDNGIATYIRAIYIYFIWAVGILAVVMITYGGIRWVAAAGNAARINDARETINNAIVGLIIALTSYTLLYVINPELLNLRLPNNIGNVNKISLSGPLTYKDSNGQCFPSSQIPCGLACYQAGTGQYVRGDCSYCQTTTTVKPETSCGQMSQGPEVLSKDGNCMYVACQNVDQACTITVNTFGQSQSTTNCQDQTPIDGLAQGGYSATTLQFSASYGCGTIWYEAASNGVFGAGARPERVWGGSSCSSTPGKHCLIDYSQNASIQMTKSQIPAGQAKTQIGSWPKKSCV